ncbi:pyridoxamine 5'-phosphate oxidase family protein [Marinobacter sp. R17]|uniref:pyridoxamine 5'-phosphate oxidase family protein n=1 Tax=Marinobacter sp. R17 TaxID=2484250 RepID=UPI000F4B052B|nr:pyridoxamine 5'-phosphate oxidase family protein [Marinobacter sp. R17]ROT94537.1 pyridoxamine 5'-phosphate oxidase family protein [Marinobacter sp. R17]
MDLERNWTAILNVLGHARRANRFFSIATVDADGNPHVTPIGHVFFRDDMTGYYFDAYSKVMPRNFEHNRRVCLMGVNSSTGFWLKSLMKGQFSSAPAVRLFGEVSDAREATGEELARLQQATRITRRLKGHRLLWRDLNRVRDIRFDGFSPASYPVMCDGLWQ